MTFGILKSRAIHGDMIKEIQGSQKYQLFGAFYESKANAQGGRDYRCEDLEIFLSQNTPDSEYGNLRDYSDELKKMNGLSIFFPHTSKVKYIRENYDRYLFYVQKK